MNASILPKRFLALTFSGALMFFAGCQKQEQPAAPAAPVVTNTPETNAASTNETSSAVITPQDARNHIGETVTVRGKVDRVYVSQKGDVFIDIGGKRPNAPFTAVCFQQAIPSADLQKFEGKVVSVKGKIKEYNGKVEIVLQTADQISE
jgi:hypothetical protein